MGPRICFSHVRASLREHTLLSFFRTPVPRKKREGRERRGFKKCCRVARRVRGRDEIQRPCLNWVPLDAKPWQASKGKRMGKIGMGKIKRAFPVFLSLLGKSVVRSFGVWACESTISPRDFYIFPDGLKMRLIGLLVWGCGAFLRLPFFLRGGGVGTLPRTCGTRGRKCV